MDDIIIKITSDINTYMVNYVRDKLYNQEKKDISIIFNSNGGEVYCVFKCISLLKTYKMLNKTNKIKGYIRNYSYSGGTILALFCDELYMSDYAFLGPIDPQIDINLNSTIQISYSELNEMIESKKSTDDEIYLQHIKMEKTHKFVENELKKMLLLHPKYIGYGDEIIKMMMNPPNHHHFYSVNDLELINIHTDGKIPEHIEKEFEIEKLNNNIQLFKRTDKINFDMQEIANSIIIGSFAGLAIGCIISLFIKKK
jgi:hypothetical protein